MKNLCFFGGSFFKIKIADILNFQWIKYLGKGLSYLKNWGIGVCYCWNYWPSKLLLHWMLLRSTQKQALENSMKLGNALFWRPLSKEMCAESLQFSTTEWWPCNFFAKLNGNHLLIANIFKLHEYQTFDLIKMHNMSKIWFVNNKFN